MAQVLRIHLLYSRSLGQEYPLKEEIATHSSILAWKIPWTVEPGGLQFMGLQKIQTQLNNNNIGCLTPLCFDPHAESFWLTWNTAICLWKPLIFSNIYAPEILLWLLAFSWPLTFCVAILIVGLKGERWLKLSTLDQQRSYAVTCRMGRIAPVGGISRMHGFRGDGSPQALVNRERIPAIKQPSNCSSSLRRGPRELRVWKTQDTGCNSWDAYERNDFSEPGFLHLPIHRKVLNSLTWVIWFSLINNNFFYVLTTCPLLQNFYVTWFLPSPPPSSSLRVIWDVDSWA